MRILQIEKHKLIMPMEKTSTLIYLVNEFEETDNDPEGLGLIIDPEFREFKNVFDFLTNQILETPRVVVDKVLDYARSVSK